MKSTVTKEGLMNTKKCTKCNQIKDLKYFSKENRRKDGLQLYCKDCNLLYKKQNKEKIQINRKKYREKNKELISLDQSRRYRKDTENRKAYAVAYGKKYKTEKKEEIADKKLKWRKSKPGKYAAYCAKRRAVKFRATPEWLTNTQLKEIENFYRLAKEIQWLSQERLEVDHIVPLQGINVCGLHVPWNLQILPKTMNVSKSNKI